MRTRGAMRTALWAFVAGAAIACQDQRGASPSPNSDDTVGAMGAVTLAAPTGAKLDCSGTPQTVNVNVELDDVDQGGQCDVFNVDPDNAEACPGWTVVWNVTNECEHEVRNLRIVNRRPKYPKNKLADPLDGDPKIMSLAPQQTKTMRATVKTAARKNLYKYDIKGTQGVDVDPEIDVRGAIPPPPPPQG